MKKIKMPDTFVIIFFVVIFASLLTYIVPVGKFEMQEVTYVTNTSSSVTSTYALSLSNLSPSTFLIFTFVTFILIPLYWLFYCFTYNNFYIINKSFQSSLNLGFLKFCNKCIVCTPTTWHKEFLSRYNWI